MKEKKKFISNVDFNNSSKACSPCNLECKKIDKRINNRKLSEIKTPNNKNTELNIYSKRNVSLSIW